MKSKGFETNFFSSPSSEAGFAKAGSAFFVRVRRVFDKGIIYILKKWIEIYNKECLNSMSLLKRWEKLRTKKMKEVDNSTVIDFTENPKNAALYFDGVVSFNLAFLSNKENTLKVKEILPTNFLIDIENYKLRYHKSNTKFIFNYSPSVSGREQDIRTLAKWLKKLFSSVSEEYPFLYPSNNSSFQNTAYDTISLKLASLSLVDTTKAEWGQILEIRKDKDSIGKLRRLKTFYHQNYSGKEKGYIQDDLLNRVEEYNDTVKDWGFETITSSLTLLNTSVTSVGSSLVLALTGQPLEVAAASGVCVGIGNVALHFAKEKHKLMKLGRDLRLSPCAGQKHR